MLPAVEQRAFVFHPSKDRLSSAGYSSVAHVPVIFFANGQYARPLNHFLRARALVEWPLQDDGGFGYAPHFLRFLTLKSIADDIINFLHYIDTEQIALDWRTIRYDPHLLRYRELQLEGKWSAKARDKKLYPLADGTVARRMLNVIDFLEFASAKGYRDKFVRPTTKVARRIIGNKGMTGSSRSYRSRGQHVRQAPIDLRIPTKSELSQWLDDVQAKKGYTKALACKTILTLALRRNECAQFRLSTIPQDRTQWRVVGSNFVIRLTEGTKRAKERSIVVPVSLAEELDKYRNGRRLKALAKWVKRNPGSVRPERLFLGEYDGTPLSTATIYGAWTSFKVFFGWSPHLARHTWACYTLLDYIKSSAKQFGVSEEALPAAWIQTTFETAMLSAIQPQLGHVSLETTRAYLSWLNMQLLMPSIYEPWHEFLELS
jgi:integrase